MFGVKTSVNSCRSIWLWWERSAERQPWIVFGFTWPSKGESVPEARIDIQRPSDSSEAGQRFGLVDIAKVFVRSERRLVPFPSACGQAVP